MKLKDLPTADTFNDGHNTLVLKVGTANAMICRLWTGRKTRSAKRDTVNLSLQCSGPKDWVLNQWATRYAVR
jgi:hypothetical protein